jgi:hypothetical protein
VSVGDDLKQDLRSRSFTLVGTNTPEGVEVRRDTSVAVSHRSHVTVEFRGVACVSGGSSRDGDGVETNDGYNVFVHDEYVGVEAEATNVLAFPTVSPGTLVTLKGDLAVEGSVSGLAAGGEQCTKEYAQYGYNVVEVITGSNTCKTIEVNVALPQMKLYALCTCDGFCNTVTTGDVWKLIDAKTSGCTEYSGAGSCVVIVSDGKEHESTVTFTQKVEVPESRVLVIIPDPEELHRNTICGLVAATFCQSVAPYTIRRTCTATDGSGEVSFHSQDIYGVKRILVNATIGCVEMS